MEWDKAYEIIIGVTIFILFIGFLKWKVNLVFSFLFRAALGIILILVMNRFLQQQNIRSIIAINPLTVTISGLLGIPGFLLLYIVNFLSFI